MAPANLRLDAAEPDEKRHLGDGNYVSLKEWIKQVDYVYRCVDNGDKLRVYIVGSLSPRFYERVLSYGWYVTYTCDNTRHRDIHGHFVDIEPLDIEAVAPLMNFSQQERE